MEMSIQSLFMGITVLIKYDNIRNSTYKHYVLHKFSSIYTQIFIVANVVIPSTHMVRCCLLEMMWCFVKILTVFIYSFLSSFSVLITIALNSLSGRLSVSLRFFYMWPCSFV